MHGQDGADVTEIADKTEWGAYRTSAARQCRTVRWYTSMSRSYEHCGRSREGLRTSTYPTERTIKLHIPRRLHMSLYEVFERYLIPRIGVRVRKLTSRILMQMVVGFFAGDIDYSGVGPLFSRLSAEYPKTWFYSVHTGLNVAW